MKGHRLLTRKEVMVLFRISHTGLDRIILSGDLVPVRIGKRGVRFRSEDIDRILEHGTGAHPQTPSDYKNLDFASNQPADQCQ